MKISLTEYNNCLDYAKMVVGFYKMWNHGKLPKDAKEAELVVREYNKEFRRFKAMYGCSIKKYVSTIVTCIGFMVNE